MYAMWGIWQASKQPDFVPGGSMLLVYKLFIL